MPNVHRKDRKQFLVRLTDKERKVLEEAAKATNAPNLSSLVIKAIMELAKKEGINYADDNNQPQ